MNSLPPPRASTALARFTVLDLSRVRAGPTCARQLADWGANVIKIEAPERLEGGDPIGGPRHAGDFQNLHRNKRSITLDLKSEGGRAALLRLAQKADVVIENFRPDVKERLRIGYADLKASIRASSMPASPPTARPGPIASGRASTRSRRAWAG
jgi:formyl-CoA transferase